MGSNERRWYTLLGIVGHLRAGRPLRASPAPFSSVPPGSTSRRRRSASTARSGSFAQAPYGPVLLGLTAAGLLAYGLFCLVQARYRRV